MNEKNEEDCATLNTIITRMADEIIPIHCEFDGQEIGIKEGMR